MESEMNIQPSFEIERFLEKFERTKKAYFELVKKGNCEDEEESEDAIQQ